MHSKKGDIKSFRKMLKYYTNLKPKTKNINLIRSVNANPRYLYRKYNNHKNM